MKINNFIVIVFSYLTISCNGSTNNNKIILQNKIQKTLSSWNLSTEVSVTETGSDLQLNISFLKKSNESFTERLHYYYDDSSNQMLIKVLLFKYKNDVFKYKNINLNLKYEGTDSISIKIGSIEKHHIIKKFKNDLFYKKALYSLENFSYEDIVFLKSSFKFINKNLNLGITNFDYWHLLSKFSEKDKLTIKLFIITAGLLENVDYEDEPENIVEKLMELLKHYNINKNIISYDIKEIDKYLKNW